MAMHTVTAFSKEREGNVSAFSSVPWWSGLGSQPADYDEHFGLLKSSSTENPGTGNKLITPTKQAEREIEQGIGKGSPTQFTIFPGKCKTSANVQKFQIQNASSFQTAAVEQQKHFELGLGQPLIRANYPYGEQCYGVFSTYGPQLAGRIMLPLNSANDEGTIFVNAKQYNGIIRRRQYRAKAEMKNKILRNRKPYLHLSRHLHAMRRPRGCGGRFLNTKNLSGSKGNTDDNKTREGKFSLPTASQTSEVLQSDSGNSSSPRESNGGRSNKSGSEVTSMYSRGDLDAFPFNHLRPTIQTLPNMMNSGHGNVLPSKWVAAADSCFNLKV